MASQQSTEMSFSVESSPRCQDRQQCSSDEAGGLEERVKNISRKLKKYIAKFHMHRHDVEVSERERGHSSSRESFQLHRRLDHMHSGIRNAQSSATCLQQSVSILESDLQDTRQRQLFQEWLSSGLMKEFVSHIKLQLWSGRDSVADHSTQEQLAARALLWDMLSQHEERNAFC